MTHLRRGVQPRGTSFFESARRPRGPHTVEPCCAESCGRSRFSSVLASLFAQVTRGTIIHWLARAVPDTVVDRLQRLANSSPRWRRILKRLSTPMRRGPRRISGGPARGLLMDLAGSRPSYLLGTAEPDVVRFFEQTIQPGDTVFDLGANVGYFTLIAAALTGPDGRVVAYEPIPANAAALRRNVQLERVVKRRGGGGRGERTRRLGADQLRLQRSACLADR